MNDSSVIYTSHPAKHDDLSFGETTIPQANQIAEESTKHMGDKSPKSNQKKSAQKQVKASSADQQKKQAMAAKQQPKKK
jgi:hypothetical protein